MNRICVVTSEATWEPVSLTEIKRHLRIETTYVDEDDDLKTMISAARRLCENKLGRQLVRAQRKLILDSFPVNSTGHISIPYPPLSSTAADLTIAYMDDSSASTSVPATVITVDYDHTPPRVYPTPDNEWPSDELGMTKNTTITYICGYVTATAVPQPIRQWVKMTAGNMYEQREGLVTVRVDVAPHTFYDGLLDPYTIHDVA